jgi:hypothetical protein
MAKGRTIFTSRQPLPLTTIQLCSSVQTNFDVVLADPPYLSDECLAKTAVTIRYLAAGKIILCTGATMEELVGRLLSLKTCAFLPHHNKNLANEFRCYANYNLDETIDSPSQT